jgi:predicted  nucleic acid-binding Zn-ribbon protein
LKIKASFQTPPKAAREGYLSSDRFSQKYISYKKKREKMNGNERPGGEKLSGCTIDQLYLELRAEKDRMRQLEKRMRRVERVVAGLCFMIDEGVLTHCETTGDLADEVETLTSQVAALSQVMSGPPASRIYALDGGAPL